MGMKILSDVSLLEDDDLAVWSCVCLFAVCGSSSEWSGWWRMEISPGLLMVE